MDQYVPSLSTLLGKIVHFVFPRMFGATCPALVVALGISSPGKKMFLKSIMFNVYNQHKLLLKRPGKAFLIEQIFLRDCFGVDLKAKHFSNFLYFQNLTHHCLNDQRP